VADEDTRVRVQRSISRRRRGWAWLCCLTGVALLGACTVHERGYEEPIELPATFGPEQAVELAPDRWWEAFGDPELNILQQQALASNFDLATFRDRLAAARAIVRRERSFLYPTIDYSAFAERSYLGGDGVERETSFGGSIIGAYEVDVWRRNASIVESAAFREAITTEQLKAAAISLSADVALTWFALVEQRGQADVLERQIETNEQVLRVVRTRFGGGVVRASDVLRQERLLESTLEQRAVVRSRIEVLEHALLVLTGRSPTESFSRDLAELPELPPKPALGIPSELVQRRPDVRSAMFAIQEADALVAVAVADRYPRVALRFEASTVENNVLNLIDDWASFLSIDLLGPLFDAGRREAEQERTEAVKAERINAYAQTILVSFRQVMDAMSREIGRSEQIVRLRRQLDLARRTSARLNREYLNGDISYIDVLEALTTEQQLQRDLLSVRFARIGDRIELYRALAGGWDGIVPTDREDEQRMADAQ
jgi:multidrug efflux system outer membrane protein